MAPTHTTPSAVSRLEDMWTLSRNAIHVNGLHIMNVNQAIPQYEIADAHGPKGNTEHLIANIKAQEDQDRASDAISFKYLNAPQQQEDVTHELTLPMYDHNAPSDTALFAWELNKIPAKTSYGREATRSQELPFDQKSYDLGATNAFNLLLIVS